jgi:serine/threonine protein phosphatase 1
MIHKLFSRNSNKAATPGGRRLYAVGDIHGCADLLDGLLALIRQDAAATPYQLVFLGDYVDRGPDSAGVLDRLVKISASTPDTIFLKGNHEAAMLDFLDAPRGNEEWLHWGGDKTLESYGLTKFWDREAEDVAIDLAKAMPAAHLSFLRGLRLYEEIGDYAFVHAGFRPGVPIKDQTEHDMLWIRGEFHNAPSENRPDKVVVHGHQPVRKPLDAGWRIDVDTGAVWSDALTAVALEGVTRRFISTSRP